MSQLPFTSIVSLGKKGTFHRVARARLRALATELGLQRGDYDLRNNMGGPAVVGEVTLHTDTLYVQVDRRDIMVRSCTSRKDYTGGPNGFLPHNLLDDIPNLAAHIKRRRVATTPYELKQRGVPA